jgi:hypothetical protein
LGLGSGDGREEEDDWGAAMGGIAGEERDR